MTDDEIKTLRNKFRGQPKNKLIHDVTVSTLSGLLDALAASQEREGRLREALRDMISNMPCACGKCQIAINRACAALAAPTSSGLSPEITLTAGGVEKFADLLDDDSPPGKALTDLMAAPTKEPE